MQIQDTTIGKPKLHPINFYITAPYYRSIIPQDLYSKHLPFFCRQELKFQKANIPLKFRLGAMDDCNRLEQKPGYR